MMKSQELRKFALSTALIAPAVLGVSVAHAATSTNPWSVSVGASFITDSTASKAVANTGFHAALDYAFEQSGNSGSGTPSLDFDYTNASGHGNHLDTYALFLSDRFMLSNNSTGTTRPYLGAGIGIADVQGSKTVNTTTSNGYTNTTVTTHPSHSVTNFAGKLIAGLSFGQGFVEAAWELDGADHGLNDNAIDLSIGTHF